MNNKIMAFCDGAPVATGFGRVAKEILMGLHRTDKYEIAQLGINYYGDPHRFPFDIYPMTSGDPFGKRKFYSTLQKIAPDVLFTINDIWALEWIVPQLNKYRQETGKRIPWVAYIPFDGVPLDAKWVEFLKNHIDIPIMYSQWAVDLIHEVDPNYMLEYIYHGVDTNTFNANGKEDIQKQVFESVSKELGREVNFAVGYVGRNQPRKRLPELFMAYREFVKDKDDCMLYLHTNVKDMGWNLDQLRQSIGIAKSQIITTPAFHPAVGIEDNNLAMIYKVFDIIALPTVGEGFGLPIVEGMAAGCVPMTTNFGVSAEIVRDAGYLIDISHYTVMPHDDEKVRPIPSAAHMADIMTSVYNTKKTKPAEFKKLKEAAINRAQDFASWNVDRWEDIMDEALEKAGAITQTLDFIFEEDDE